MSRKEMKCFMVLFLSWAPCSPHVFSPPPFFKYPDLNFWINNLIQVQILNPNLLSFRCKSSAPDFITWSLVGRNCWDGSFRRGWDQGWAPCFLSSLLLSYQVFPCTPPNSLAMADGERSFLPSSLLIWNSFLLFSCFTGSYISDFSHVRVFSLCRYRAC